MATLEYFGKKILAVLAGGGFEQTIERNSLFSIEEGIEIRLSFNEDPTEVGRNIVTERISGGRRTFIIFLLQIINQFLLCFQAQCLDLIEFFVFSLKLGKWEVPEGLQKIFHQLVVALNARLILILQL